MYDEENMAILLLSCKKIEIFADEFIKSEFLVILEFLF